MEYKNIYAYIAFKGMKKTHNLYSYKEVIKVQRTNVPQRGQLIVCVGGSNRGGNLRAGDPALDSSSVRWAAYTRVQ